MISALAAPRAYDTIDLTRTLHTRGTSRIRVELTDKGFQFNGVALPPGMVGVYARALHVLRPQGKSRQPAARCLAGRGEITRTQGKIRTTENFCVEDKRGQEINEALVVLNQQARLGAALRK